MEILLTPCGTEKSSMLIKAACWKKGHTITPHGWFQSCLHKPAEQTSEQHTLFMTPYLPPSNITQHNPGQIESPTPTKLKSINSEFQTNTDSRCGVEHRTCPKEQGWGMEPNCQWRKMGKLTKTESGGVVTSQLPKVGPVVDPWADLMTLRVVLKTELPHLAEEGANHKELQL
jgi:hypothetical protein